jgi:hypothetical protein
MYLYGNSQEATPTIQLIYTNNSHGIIEMSWILRQGIRYKFDSCLPWINSIILCQVSETEWASVHASKNDYNNIYSYFNIKDKYSK